jgi:hypothetical protein
MYFVYSVHHRTMRFISCTVAIARKMWCVQVLGSMLGLYQTLAISKNNLATPLEQSHGLIKHTFMAKVSLFKFIGFQPFEVFLSMSIAD